MHVEIYSFLYFEVPDNLTEEDLANLYLDIDSVTAKLVKILPSGVEIIQNCKLEAINTVDSREVDPGWVSLEKNPKRFNFE